MPRLAESTRTARREQILTAALTCFARAGFHATTMADIATQAGLAKGTPYLYFASNEQLYAALPETWECALAKRIDAAVEQLSATDRGSPRQVLRAVVEAVGAHLVEQPQTCRVLMEEAQTLAGYQPAIAAAVQAADTRAVDALERLFSAGVAAGRWPPGSDSAVLARLVVATLHGLMAQWHLAPGSSSWEATSEALAGVATTRTPGPEAGGRQRALDSHQSG